MRKDITTNILVDGCGKINKSALARQYGCCWRTIDRRFNPDKYKHDKKESDIVDMVKKINPDKMTPFIKFSFFKKYSDTCDFLSFYKYFL